VLGQKENIKNEKIWKRVYWELYTGQAKVVVENAYLISSFLYVLSHFDDVKRNSKIYIKNDIDVKSVEFLLKSNGILIYVYTNNKKLLWAYLDSRMFIFDEKFIKIHKDIYNNYEIKIKQYKLKECEL